MKIVRVEGVGGYDQIDGPARTPRVPNDSIELSNGERGLQPPRQEFFARLYINSQDMTFDKECLNGCGEFL